MPNGNEMMDAMKFEEMIKDYSPAERFLARQMREVKMECERRKTCTPQVIFSRKQYAIGGLGITAIVTIVASIIELIKSLI